tara:strand:- start:7704 stop:7919 length:216 start_codon:yes stop_codon:yes gene_type:complete
MEDIFQSTGSDDEYLVRFVVNPMRKCFDLYGSEGSHQTVECDTEKFMDILRFTRDILEEQGSCEMVYVNPL